VLSVNDRKTIDYPSGEKAGCSAPESVPGIGRGSGSAIERPNSCRLATYTIRVPSGEMATD
jgi:hypothetical protein